MLPTWMAVPYLITAFGGLLLSNNLSVYSAGLTTLTLGPEGQARLRGGGGHRGDLRRLDLLHADRRQFLRPVHHLHFPAGGADHRVGRDLRGRSDSPSLLQPQGPAGRRPSSAYWYRGGVEWRAFGAWAVAIVLGFSFTTIGTTGRERLVQGFLSDSWLGHNGLGWIVTFRGGRWHLPSLGGAKDRRAAQSRECSC